MGDWRNTTWGELATLEYGRALRRYGESAEAFPVYGTNGPIGWHSEALCTHAGVIIGRKGAYRGVHYSPTPFFVIDTAFYLEPKANIDLKWAYYELLTHDINGLDTGSAIPSTTREAFYALKVRVPPIEEQRTIARVLGALDDKIDLNRRMNETLEAIARTIFKSWFVDFEPVRAKKEGRRLEVSGRIAALFPDRFEASELGPIPVGWTIKAAGDVAQRNRHGAVRFLHQGRNLRRNGGSDHQRPAPARIHASRQYVQLHYRRTCKKVGASDCRTWRRCIYTRWQHRSSCLHPTPLPIRPIHHLAAPVLHEMRSRSGHADFHFVLLHVSRRATPAPCKYILVRGALHCSSGHVPAIT